DICGSDPCLNNGSCLPNIISGYECTCRDGFIGLNCDTDLCASAPCFNNGTCVGIPENYKCNCPFGFAGYDCEILEMMQDFRLNEISLQEFGKSIPVIWEMTSGINVTVNVTYNGIPCCSAGPLTNTTGQCDCLISDPDLFDTDGMVNISATAWNRISGPETKSLDIEVLKKIEDISFAMLTTYAQFGSGVEGAGPNRNIFPAEYPVEFNISYTGGPVATVECSIICSVDSFTNMTEYAFEKSFSSTESQDCDVTLHLQNSIDATGNRHTSCRAPS
ncbi:neurogenic locus notch homolog 1, partial [Paramuricea clavata]